MTFLKIFVLAFTIIILLSSSTFIWAKYASPLLVLDMRDKLEFPKHFRTSSDHIAANINLTGLADLHIAGSGQFSNLALQKIRQHLQAKELTIIDLRQESHGFLNENAISWYGTANADNVGLTDDQIRKKQALFLSALSQQKTISVYNIIKKTPAYKIASAKPEKFSVQNVMSEAELAKKLALNYQRIFVQDYHAPTDEQVDRFVEIVKQLPANQWIYFHCRAGVGRSTTFMAMYDMMRNAKHVEFDDILQRQAALGGKDLTAFPAAGSHKYQSAVDRLIFLEKFYEYALKNTDNFNTKWSDWGDN